MKDNQFQSKIKSHLENNNLLEKFKRKLIKTRHNIGTGLANLLNRNKIDEHLFQDIEEQLILADISIDLVSGIISNIKNQLNQNALYETQIIYDLVKVELAKILKKSDQPLQIDNNRIPFIILAIGVNGTGKTTTIGKLAKQLHTSGKSVVLAAGDTFRAAAIEQLQFWGKCNGISVISQHPGSDSAAVIFDAIKSAKSRGINVIIADTAGRLQNKLHLMDELKKIVRTIKKIDNSAPHEIMLIIDATTGHNAINQTKLFNEMIGVTGITLTKLDGTAKGGVIFSIANQFNIPIRYLGIGESMDDLRPFNSEEFIEAIFYK